MEQKRNRSRTYSSVYYYTVITDILRNWLVIILMTASAAMLMYVHLYNDYRPEYRTSTTLVITNVGVDNNMYKNLNSASDAAGRFWMVTLSVLDCVQLLSYSFEGALLPFTYSGDRFVMPA